MRQIPRQHHALTGWRDRRALMEAARPAVFAAAVLEFIQVWNDIAVSLQIRGGDPIGFALLQQTRQFASAAPDLCAAGLLASMVPILLVALARRRILELLGYGVVLG
jgi:alpha-glucoside transport system permease protein